MIEIGPNLTEILKTVALISAWVACVWIWNR